MTERYGFYINSAACSGCKTCQVACRDKNDLHQGQNWRRVYEVEGGDWKSENGAWTALPYSYYLSVSCNHCTDPECVKACPTTAMHINDLGIVLVDSEKCMGCGYCAWACPYDAPQPNPETGRMTKCDLCYDKIVSGENPSCVDSCPMRALEFGTMKYLEEKYGSVRSVCPLPDPSVTNPNMVINPHRDAARAGKEPGIIVNREEL
ncbi:MAG: DMSO/selenate family reductase complex B subunit [Bacteroidales bacterium]